MIRLFDIFFSLCGLIFGFPILLILYIVGLFDTGSPLFKQERVGKNKQPFTLVKFRTMKLNTESVASHLADVSMITPFGSFLRRTKLDELPQLWNVVMGDMSLVGPRPGLFNQHQLIQERDKFDIYSVRPGITGYAQINEVDMSTPEKLARYDSVMIQKFTIAGYFRYILATVAGKGQGDRVS